MRLLRRTAFDISLVIFVVSAGAGVWAAYDPASAGAKFGRIAASILLFYLIANLRAASPWSTAWVFSLVNALVSFYFLMSYDWSASPVPLWKINRVGETWMQMRPAVHLPILSADVAGAITAMLFPFNLLTLLHSWRQRCKRAASVAFLCSLVVAVGLLLAVERGAWFGLAIGLTGWLGWTFSKKLSRLIHWPAKLIFWGGSSAILALVMLILRFPPPFLAYPLERLMTNTRLEGFTNSLHLMADYPWIGGGLGAFAGLYSRYILGIHYLYITNSHNLFLDIGIEQGWAGLASFVSIWIISLILLAKGNTPEQTALRMGSAVGITTMLLHGLTEDAFYAEVGLVGVFILPGFVAALSSTAYTQSALKSPLASSVLLSSYNPKRWSRKIFLFSVGLSFVLLAFLLQRDLVSAWHANLGAIQLAKVQLKGWPAERVEGEKLLAHVPEAEKSFTQSLTLNPFQATALYRLGLIALERRDFAAAKAQLNLARQQLPYHHGISKALGYACLWQNDLVCAEPLLAALPEAQKELGSYAQWWKTQDRLDLSNQAKEMAIRLKSR